MAKMSVREWLYTCEDERRAFLGALEINGARDDDGEKYDGIWRLRLADSGTWIEIQNDDVTVNVEEGPFPGADLTEMWESQALRVCVDMPIPYEIVAYALTDKGEQAVEEDVYDQDYYDADYDDYGNVRDYDEYDGPDEATYHSWLIKAKNGQIIIGDGVLGRYRGEDWGQASYWEEHYTKLSELDEETRLKIVEWAKPLAPGHYDFPFYCLDDDQDEDDEATPPTVPQTIDEIPF